MSEPGVYIGPIQHHESQTVECWCRHCVWWKERAAIAERERLVDEAHGHHDRVHGGDWDSCVRPVCYGVQLLAMEGWLLAEPAP